MYKRSLHDVHKIHEYTGSGDLACLSAGLISETTGRNCMKFGIVVLLPMLSCKFHFRSYLFNITRTLHEGQTELHQFLK
jgi:hypothetical protein